MAGEAAGEELVEEGVAEAFGGGDDLLGALDGLVDGVEHGGDGALLGEGREEEGITCPSGSTKCGASGLPATPRIAVDGAAGEGDGW